MTLLGRWPADLIFLYVSVGLEPPRSPAPRRRGCPLVVPQPVPGRPHLTSLDGLRGGAAVVVVVFHVLIVSPAWMTAYEEGVTDTRDPLWWLSHTPLALSWLGTEAVLVFFVLSGVVLALPAAAGRPPRWRSYFPKRLVRLYLPVWASLALAVLWTVLVPRTPDPGRSDWYNDHVPVQPMSEVLQDAVLLSRPGWINSPLWSLQWEVLFSLLLPLYLICATVARRQLLAGGVLLLAVLTVVQVYSWALLLLGVFAVGVLLAYGQDQLQQLADRLDAVRAGWTVVVTLTVVLLTNQALLKPHDPLPLPDPVGRALQLLGCALLVFMALHWRPFERALSRPAAQYVGKRSFSLYLVHEPLLVSLVVLLPSASVGVLLALTLPLSLLLAHVFYAVVERPSMRLAARAGQLGEAVGSHRPSATRR